MSDRWWGADDPGPVAEYRDAELARRFSSDPVPAHGPEFWADLERAVPARPVGSAPPDPAPSDPASFDPAPAGAGSSATEGTADGPVLDLVDGGGAADGLGRRSDSQGTSGSEHRNAPGRWLVAAAVLVVAGVGLTALVASSSRFSPVRSAGQEALVQDQVGGGGDRATAAEPPVVPGTDAASADAALTTTTTTMAMTTVGQTGIDYFGGPARVRGLGRGHLVAFSPDDSTAVIVDDAPGVARGCEGAELLTLFAQDLTSGTRRPALGPTGTVETGGLDLEVSPFGDRPAQVGTWPVYWTEYCDGVRSITRRAVMNPSGLMTVLGDVELGGELDPFDDGPGAARSSPDGTRELVLGLRSASVVDRSGDADPDPERRLPDAAVERLEADLTTGVWSPGGDVVALAAGTGVVLWDPDDGRWRWLDARSVTDVVFDNSGQRLAVVSLGQTVETTVVTFGDLADPVAAAARCSGRVDMAPLDVPALVADGVPVAVGATMAALDQAAASCDWAALEALVSDGFVAGLGADSPIELWRQQEAGHDSPLWYLRALLRQPRGVDAAADPHRSVWPALLLRDDCATDRADREGLTALGYDPATVAASCRQGGGYTGYSVAIDHDGQWRWFLAGPRG